MEQSEPEEDVTVFPEEAPQPEEVSDAEWMERYIAMLGKDTAEEVLANIDSARVVVKSAYDSHCPLRPEILEETKRRWRELFPEEAA